jgi:polysaccharide biosynthesis/export protein
VRKLFNTHRISKRHSDRIIQGITTIGIAAFCFFMTSCASYKNIPYFKNLPDSTYVYKNGVKVTTTAYEELKIQPDDILQVSIQTIDPELNNVMGTGVPAANK